MWLRVCLSFALIAAIPGRSQVTIGGGAGPGYTDGLGSSGQMRTPPPVNGDSYSALAGAEVRSNYLRLALIETTVYSDNVLGDAFKPVSDVSYLINPTITIDKTTSRQHLTFAYTPGFTIYQQTSVLNQASQYLTFAEAYRLTRHVTLSLQDSFHYTSNFLDQPDPLAVDVNPVSTAPSLCDYRSRGGPDRQWRESRTDRPIQYERHDRCKRNVYRSALFKVHRKSRYL